MTLIDNVKGRYINEFMRQNLEIAKKVIRKDLDMIFIVDGAEGSFSSDTEIQISRCKVSRKYTIKQLYNHFNGNPDKIIQKNKQFDLKIPCYVRSYNGKDIRLHKIHNVVYSGIKTTYKLTLDNGYSIKVSADHKIMTDNGWKQLMDLTPFDNIMCDTLKAESKNRKRIKLYDVSLPVRYHHYSGRVEVHRLIYEAYMNEISFLEYLDILLNEQEKAKTLKYIDVDKYLVHHLDGCHYNNDIKNLKVMNKSEHHFIHNNYNNFNQGVPKWSRVKSIVENKREPTYDIQCDEPYHNFVANGIVVHNSGKSVCAMQQAYYCDPTININRICFTPNEFRKAVLSANKYESVIYDEGFTGLSSRGTMSLINRTLINMLAEIRQKNLFIWVIAPSFFDMDRYVVLHRSRALIHVYMNDDFSRGNFAFYNVDRKKDLYINGKKFNNYRCAKPNFIGDFTNWYPVNEAAYRKKKHDSLTIREQSSSDEQLKKEVQDNLFMRLAELELPLTHEVKAKILGIHINTYYYKLKKYQENRDLFSDT